MDLVNWKKLDIIFVGEGVTTTDLNQAIQWSKRMAQSTGGEQNSCVIVIRCIPSIWTRGHFSHHVFLGASLNWASYILQHRASADDPCPDHSHGNVISSPMADNRTAKIIGKYAYEYLKGNHEIVDFSIVKLLKHHLESLCMDLN